MMDPLAPEEFPLSEDLSEDPTATAPALPATLFLSPEQVTEFGLGECLPGTTYTATLTVSEGGEEAGVGGKMFEVDSVTANADDGQEDDLDEDLYGTGPDRRLGRNPPAPVDFGKMRKTVS